MGHNLQFFSPMDGKWITSTRMRPANDLQTMIDIGRQSAEFNGLEYRVLDEDELEIWMSRCRCKSCAPDHAGERTPLSCYGSYQEYVAAKVAGELDQ